MVDGVEGIFGSMQVVGYSPWRYFSRKRCGMNRGI